MDNWQGITYQPTKIAETTTTTWRQASDTTTRGRITYVKSTTKKIKRVISSYGISTCLKVPRQPRESLKIDWNQRKSTTKFTTRIVLQWRRRNCGMYQKMYHSFRHVSQVPREAIYIRANSPYLIREGRKSNLSATWTKLIRSQITRHALPWTRL